MATKNANKNTDLILANADVPSIIDQIKAKIAELKDIETTPWKAGKNLTGFGNIQEEKLQENLHRAWSMIWAKEKAWNDAMTELMTRPDGSVAPFIVFKQDGYTKEDWKHDIILRGRIIDQKETLDTLKGFEKEMSQFLSAEDQKAILLKKMQSFLADK